MAKRFGGKYSPDGNADSGATSNVMVSDDRRVDPAGGKSNVMFVPPVVLAFTSIRQEPTTMITGLICAAILGLGAWLLREGLRAEAAYNARSIARRPALPRKILAAILASVGIAGAALSKDAGIIGAVIYGIAAGGLHIAAFGIDPLQNKRLEGIDDFQQDRVARVVDEAETYLSAMSDHIASLNDRKLDIRVASFQSAARHMIRTVEEDPRDLTGARKYLGVYLMGARDAAVKFADLYKRAKDEDARSSFEQLLTDLESNFAAKTNKMLNDDRTDMDIEIKVLRDRLKREGVKPE
ncbi:hypothetical protein BVC71_00855 [Marivivens niveibacter]|uniref:5-bromo-4-chloroindolyl phosphate hydrolysis protein n=1 Tax=Marivivens niveibacter TaxID=1930667 RepID=A0A251X032_9RHOB|nr:5-bromo-4-chloroindolyl phosphate hydrolysis family protein [Marivivens niveibacter]OUD10100.1 hypothetical protein BVC71_00855 [Marivivens niveibacter]